MIANPLTFSKNIGLTKTGPVLATKVVRVWPHHFHWPSGIPGGHCEVASGGVGGDMFTTTFIYRKKQ